MDYQQRQMPTANILGDILKTLQKLEKRLDGQSSRLVAIELSVHSGYTSPKTTGTSSVSSNNSSSAYKQQDGVYSSTTTASSSHPNSPASLYRKSVAELRKRFDFVDDSISDLNGSHGHSYTDEHAFEHSQGTQAPSDMWASIDGSLSEQLNGDNDDVVDLPYTESAYSRPLSQFDVSKLAEHPPLPQDHAGFGATFEPTVSGSPGQQSGSSCTIDVSTHPALRRYSQRHERVELAYLAYENFKSSLRSSLSIRSSQRRDEQQRLRELYRPVTTSVPSFGHGNEKTTMLRVLWIRSMNYLSSWSLRKVDNTCIS
ncbi:hypothetical protein BJ170DRAFT_712748 [Xylariales sp. AK1849]|nr:hypothetical protein BJ170DRAFT_712748 [Xylariales sp. AK1849]